ncbi:MAG: hypothetical protein V5A21_01070 [Halapricum sp.]
MDRLSSCYFCGDAVDAAIEEYPLVRSEQYPDIETGQRIVLCPSCRRKLTTVVERVLEAALDSDSQASAQGIPELDEDDPLIDLDREAEDAMTATDVQQMSGSDEAGATTSEDDGGIEQEGDTDDQPASGDSTGWVEKTSGDEVGDDETEADDDTTEQVETEVDDDPAEQDDEASGSDATEGDDAYEQAEYNKVVRLLQNREFPVDIEEITVVARSAYNIDRETTHEILEALIDRGVVEDKGDRLVRP